VPLALAAGLQVEARRHKLDEGLWIGGHITADSHLAEFWIGKVKPPSGLTRDLGNRFVQRLAVKRQHVVAQAAEKGASRASRAGLSSRSATELRLARLGPLGFDP
jgi:hypothetical protein